MCMLFRFMFLAQWTLGHLFYSCYLEWTAALDTVWTQTPSMHCSQRSRARKKTAALNASHQNVTMGNGLRF